MTVAARSGAGATTAYLIPSAQLVDEGVLRPRCPFRGLAPFTENDAELFHGRAEEIERLRGAVARHPLTLVVGPSGSGKSSLVRAGLLPRLQREGFSVSELRAVPGADPAAALARAVVPVLEPGLGEVGRLRAAAELAGLLTQEAAGALRDRLLTHGGTGGHVLFVDQLEEYAGERPDAARQLLRLLVALSSARPYSRRGCGVGSNPGGVERASACSSPTSPTIATAAAPLRLHPPPAASPSPLPKPPRTPQVRDPTRRPTRQPRYTTPSTTPSAPCGGPAYP
ncbi:ATP-binding protein [Streptomyces sp. NPDC090445]|uniref:ATP-binding protein n=1 Tax=Streptomyces sp. NPDC090445 TaxID=3365963 RepID=UPI003828D7FD